MNDRQTHIDLLSQVADSTAERDNVRRILGDSATIFNGEYAPYAVTDSVLHSDAHERYKRAPFPVTQHNHAHRHSRACSRCESGLTQRVTPTACECAEPARPKPMRGDLYRVLAMATWPVYAVALGAFFAWLLS